MILRTFAEASIVAAAAFAGTGRDGMSIEEANRTLGPLLGPISATVFALALLTNDGAVMGPFVNGRITRSLGWLTVAVLLGLNAPLLWMTATGK